MPRKTYVIRETSGRYYRSFFDSYLTTAHCKVLVAETDDITKARKFHFLWWATGRVKYLSEKSYGYYYVFEVIGRTPEQKLLIKNESVIKKIRENDEFG